MYHSKPTSRFVSVLRFKHSENICIFNGKSENTFWMSLNPCRLQPSPTLHHLGWLHAKLNVSCCNIRMRSMGHLAYSLQFFCVYLSFWSRCWKVMSARFGTNTSGAGCRSSPPCFRAKENGAASECRFPPRISWESTLSFFSLGGVTPCALSRLDYEQVCEHMHAKWYGTSTCIYNVPPH